MMLAERPDPSSQVAAGRAAEHEAGPVIGAMGTDGQRGTRTTGRSALRP